MSGLFLSYSRADRALAAQIVRAMRAVGVAVWWDEDMSAVYWQQELASKIHELSGVLVIWTEASIRSVNVQDEARLARREDKLLNVMVGVSAPPFPFDGINGFHLDDWTGREPHRGWSRVVAAVEELVVQKGGAKPGEITVAQAMREEQLREHQKAVGAAQANLQRLQSREAETGEAKRQADITVEKAQDQLQRVAEMRAGPAVLRAAQAEFDAAFEAREVAAATLQKLRRELERASADLASAMEALEAVAASSEPPTKVPAAAPRSRPRHETPVPEPDPPARAPRKPRAAASSARPAPPPSPAAQDDNLVMAAAPAPPPPAFSLAAPPSLSIARRPLIAAGIGAGLLLAVGAVFLMIRPPTASASHAAAAPAPPPTGLDPQTASAAAALAGNWTIQGMDCNDPVTLSVSGDQLSLTLSGKTSVAAILPGATGGTVRTQGAEGESTYSLRGATLSVAEAGGAPTRMTRCGA